MNAIARILIGLSRKLPDQAEISNGAIYRKVYGTASCLRSKKGLSVFLGGLRAPEYPLKEPRHHPRPLLLSPLNQAHLLQLEDHLVGAVVDVDVFGFDAQFGCFWDVIRV